MRTRRLASAVTWSATVRSDHHASGVGRSLDASDRNVGQARATTQGVSFLSLLPGVDVMKRVLAIVLVASAFVLMAGCGASKAVQPTVTPTPSPTVSAVSSDGTYLVGTDIMAGTYQGDGNQWTGKRELAGLLGLQGS